MHRAQVQRKGEEKYCNNGKSTQEKKGKNIVDNKFSTLISLASRIYSTKNKENENT